MLWIFQSNWVQGCADPPSVHAFPMKAPFFGLLRLGFSVMGALQQFVIEKGAPIASILDSHSDDMQLAVRRISRHVSAPLVLKFGGYIRGECASVPGLGITDGKLSLGHAAVSPKSFKAPRAHPGSHPKMERDTGTGGATSRPRNTKSVHYLSMLQPRHSAPHRTHKACGEAKNQFS